MHSDDSSSTSDTGDATALPALAPLRIIALGTSPVFGRRHVPRRRIAAAFLVERRRADRRRAKPGIDGLLRVVLADNWTGGRRTTF